MRKKPTIFTVAEAAGVSTSTVSQVLRGSGRISEDTRRKVIRAAEKVNYVQDRRAAAMRSGESRDIGLLIHNIANPFNAEVVVGANSYFEEHGYLVYVLDALDDPARERRYLQTMIGSHPAGLLWVPANGTEARTIEWVRAQSPVTVSFLRPVPDHPFDHVGFDSTLGTQLATRHLVELGHRDIAFLGGAYDTATLAQRVSGYLSGLMGTETGAPVIEKCVESKQAAMEATISLLTAHPRLTGIVCNCDVVAAGATLGLARLGLEPGADVSVVGFDDIADSKLWSPPLTTVAVDPKGIGQQIAEALLARKANKDAPIRTVNLPVRLQVRSSTGRPRPGGQNGKGNRG